ncbi:hypothetical protein CVS40_9305 [Lucilia cuprina]|nr:hypothetical protein CVS40_9305 [Lucilia cuprina]
MDNYNAEPFKTNYNLPAMSKIVENLMYEQILTLLEDYYHPNQYAFTPKLQHDLSSIFYDRLYTT